jgi:hypothetical protein
VTSQSGVIRDMVEELAMRYKWYDWEASRLEMARLVYRSGSARDDNLTPRPGKDTAGKQGQAPGLSTFTTLEQAVLAGGKAQVIDLDLLGSPLHGYPDEVGFEGAVEGHVSIAPARSNGSVDHELLAEWAWTRNSEHSHWLTELIKQAHIGSVKRPRWTKSKLSGGFDHGPWCAGC